MTEGASVAIEAIGEDGLHRWLEAVGPADPCVARQAAPHSLRASLGTDSIRNAIHTSCSSADQLRVSTFLHSAKRSCLPLCTTVLHHQLRTADLRPGAVHRFCQAINLQY